LQAGLFLSLISSIKKEKDMPEIEMTMQSQPRYEGKNWLDLFINLLDDITILCLIGLVLTVVFQILTRNLFSHGFPWTDELARWWQVTLVFLAVPVLGRDGIHLRVDIVTESFPPKVLHFFNILASVLSLAFCLVFVYAFVIFMLKGWDIPTAVLNWPILIFFIALPIGVGTNILVMARILYRQIKGEKE
jgi:C4-dicarboxylate transporter DctQ subunit